MYLLINILLIIFCHFVNISTQNYVSASSACAKVGNHYPRGCSGLTSELLGRPYKTANRYTQGTYIGSNGEYTGVSPGELVGFPGHVAIYVGHSGCQCMFIDVPAPRKNARCLGNGYGNQAVYKYFY